MTESRFKHGTHLPVLDGIRGLAIALVMLQHFFHGIEKGPSFVDDVVFGLAARSWMGVDLFFVLSGFLITGILWDTKSRPHYFRNFYMRRVLRIFPAYYLVLFVFYVVLDRVPVEGIQLYLVDSAPDQVWHWTYLTNFRIAWRDSWYPQHIPNVFWSLAIEEQFYMIWPMVVLALSRRALMRLCVALFVGALALRVVLSVATDASWVSRFVMTPTRMDGLVLGAFLAMLVRGDIDLVRARRVFWWIGAVALVPLTALTFHRPSGWREMPVQELRFTAVALVFGALLFLAVTARPGQLLERGLANRFMRMLGKYSYALYLWHGPMDTLAFEFINPNYTELIAGSRLPAQLLYTAIASVMSLVAAWLSWNLVEKHFLRLKDRFASRPKSAAAA